MGLSWAQLMWETPWWVLMQDLKIFDLEATVVKSKQRAKLAGLQGTRK